MLPALLLCADRQRQAIGRILVKRLAWGAVEAAPHPLGPGGTCRAVWSKGRRRERQPGAECRVSSRVQKRQVAAESGSTAVAVEGFFVLQSLQQSSK